LIVLLPSSVLNGSSSGKNGCIKEIPERKRREGAGRKYALETLEGQLLLTLVWPRLYLAYFVLEHLFGIDESAASRTITRIQPLLQGRFMLPARLPRKKIRNPLKS
jgi:hypothetical protein